MYLKVIIGTMPLMVLLLYFLTIYILIDEDVVKASKRKTRRFKNDTGNPAIIIWTARFELYSVLRCEEGYVCDLYHTQAKVRLPRNTEGVYYFYGSRFNFSNLPLPRNPTKVIWALSHEETPRNVLAFMHEAVLSVFNFSSTFSRYSDVPFPLFYMGSLNEITSTKSFVKTAVKNSALKEIAPILYMASDCRTSTERDQYVEKLMKYQQVDSYGLCVNNKRFPKELNKIQRNYMNYFYHPMIIKFISRYKFIIAMENGVCNDYITEKFWRAIRVGVVPIYFGSPSIRDWLPNPKSAILVEDFSSPKRLSEHLDKLMRDDHLYEEYLEHKLEGKISNQKLKDEIEKRPYQTNEERREYTYLCFLCKQLHIKQKTVHVVTQKHYDCPRPYCALKKCKIGGFDFLWVASLNGALRLNEDIMTKNEVTVETLAEDIKPHCWGERPTEYKTPKLIMPLPLEDD